jgi:1-acyl-sn-glycerol-3-phosphate acyltransferase
MFETFYLQTIFESSVFILKKELMRIPLFGSYLKKMGCVSIDRDKISKENLGFTGLVGKVLDDKRNTLIIFPQGTRKDYKDRSKFKKGFARIYNDFQINCLPIAINSGKTWPKSSFLKSKQNITVSILKSFEPGKDIEKFSMEVENLIYKELDLIN